MTPKMILTYFDIPGSAEPLRYALALSGKEWEDKRLSREEFGTLKPTLPFGQVPTLEVDGKVICQSLAILRFVGKHAGLYPEDPMEAAMADIAADAVLDCYVKLAPTMQMKDEAKKMEMRKDLAENFLPMWLGKMEKRLEAAGGEYFAGGKLSTGDLAVVCRLEWFTNGFLDGIPSTVLDPCPLLNALTVRVNAEPKIAAYREARIAAAK